MIVAAVCLFFWLSARLYASISPKLQWLGRPLSAWRYVMHYRFLDNLKFAHNELYGSMSDTATANDVITSLCTG